MVRSARRFRAVGNILYRSLHAAKPSCIASALGIRICDLLLHSWQFFALCWGCAKILHVTIPIRSDRRRAFRANQESQLSWRDSDLPLVRDSFLALAIIRNDRRVVLLLLCKYAKKGSFPCSLPRFCGLQSQDRNVASINSRRVPTSVAFESILGTKLAILE